MNKIAQFSTVLAAAGAVSLDANSGATSLLSSVAQAELTIHEALQHRGLSEADEARILGQVSTLATTLSDDDWDTVGNWLQAQTMRAGYEEHHKTHEGYQGAQIAEDLHAQIDLTRRRRRRAQIAEGEAADGEQDLN